MGFWRQRSFYFYFLVGLILVAVLGGLAWRLLSAEALEVTLSSPQIPELAGYTYPIYELTASLDGEGKTLRGNCILTYTNNEEANLSELFFHLYPNAPLFTEYTSTPGSLEIKSVKVDGEETIWQVDSTILKVRLPAPLAPGEATAVEIPFTMQIPAVRERFGVKDQVVSLGNWYPILAVYDGEWHLDPYYEIGDPFYSDIALYRVTFDVSRRHTVAATGSLLSVEKTPCWRKRLYFETGPVRDFALAISSRYQVVREECGGIMVQSFYPRGHELAGKLALQATKEALQFFQETFGPYPYDQLTVAATGMFAGGMEYPNIVFIGNDLYREGSERALEYIVVHEVAHQWWYGLVGNDQIREPWLDEGLADFSTQLFYEVRRPELAGNLPNSLAHFYEMYKDNVGGGIIRRPLWEFKSDLEYSVLVYGKGSIVFSQLRETLGDEDFFALLQQYLAEYKYRHVTIDEFIEFCQQVTDLQLGEFFYKWLETA
ncbi:MAG: M1 family metallopeptidase [bacterium]